MTNHIIRISTNLITNCEHCSTRIGGENFAESVNHYIEKHDYKILHVGTETTNEMNGALWQSTVAIVGK